MNEYPVAVRACRAWVRLYTSGLPADAADRRVLEIDSDIWEQLHDPDGAFTPRHLLGRTIRGVHADVWWRYRTLLDHRGARQRSNDMTTTARDWWARLTAVAGTVITAVSIAALADRMSEADGLAVYLAGLGPAVGGVLILIGLALTRTKATTGSWVVIAGSSLAALGDLVAIPLAALIVIGGLWTGGLTTTERADTIDLDLDPVRDTLAGYWFRLLAASAALFAVGFAALLVWEHSGLVPDDCTETNPCWEDTAAWATWGLSWLAAIITGGMGIVLGILRFTRRHHTRPTGGISGVT